MLHNINISRLFLCLIILCNLTFVLDGCGFRLRGSLGNGIALPAVYLQGTAGSAIMVELKQTMQSIGTEVVSDKALAHYVLNIINEQRSRRILSVSSAGKVQEYELNYAVIFTVTDSQGAPLLSDQKISFTRSFSFAETDVLAKGTEEESLIETMRQEAVLGIIRRMQALQSQKTEPQTTKPESHDEVENGAT